MKNFLRKIIPNFLFSWYHFVWALLGAVVYRFPSRKLKVIGVTGTNGKSTVVFLVSQILEKAGYQVAAVSSVQFKIKDKVWVNDLKMTMPGRLKLQKFLHQAVQAGCQYVVLEVTSEGIKQHRHRFIGFETAVLTNLTPEHLESHGGFENYKKAKGKLFQALKPQGKIIVNLDDPNAGYFLQFRIGEKWGYTMQENLGAKPLNEELNSQKIVCGSLFTFTQNGISFKVQDRQFNLNLLGKFNAYNALAAIAIGLAEKIPLDKIKVALEKAQGIPGRLEIVIKEPFAVIVDYAHTPDALEKVYQTLKEVFAGRMIGVLGAAGGGRDKWKRPQLGKIAEQYLDKIIITNEDPYDENPQTIIDEIAEGIKQKETEKILDRRQAIRRALELAQAGDVVIITGKGCEPWMCLAGGKKMPWDDREVVKEEFSKL
jgi:UDP-N-acetylmuramoyl-L-alanyl-D-glutamate--2,6-diaminopimelate ligase